MEVLVYRVLRQQMFAALVLIILVAAPTVHAQDEPEPEEVREDITAQPGTPITFYGHLFEHDRPMPINTQFPDGEDDYSIGFAQPCGTPPPLPDGTLEQIPSIPQVGKLYPSCDEYEGNEMFFYSTAGFVQAKSREEFINNGRHEQLHNERGQTKDIFLDTDQPASGVIYMSADFHGWLVLLCDVACWNWDPGYFEDWSVEGWIWSVPLGDYQADPSSAPDMDAIRDRSAEDLVPIAYGRSEPKTMASFDPTLPAEPLCGGPCQTVHDFPIDYEWDPDFVASGGVVPKEHDLVFEFEWSQYTDGQEYIASTHVAGTLWNVNGGEDYPNRVVLPVRNPLDVELVFPNFIHDKLVILSVINTPWGSYDIDTDETRLTIHDADGNVVPIDEDTIQGGVETSVSHAGHYMPIEGQWIWDFQEQGLEPGDYTVTVETINFQHSATASTSASFTIDKEGKGTATSSGRSGLQTFDDSITDVDPDEADEELKEATADSKDSPAVGVLGVLAVAAVAVAVRRSRR